MTSDLWDVASAFTWDPWGTKISYVADGSVMVTEVGAGQTSRLTPPSAAVLRPEACVFSPGGGKIAFVREVAGIGGRFNQVFLVDV